jgi:hypothetical protein
MNIQLKEKEVIVDGVSYFLKEENNNSTPQTEFKVGDWITWIGGGNNPPYPIRKIKEMKRYQSAIDHSDVSIFLNPNYYRLSTREEVESHLREICDEKYVGKRINADNYRITNKRHTSPYVPQYDQYWMVNTRENGVLVYEAGKFEEVIPDKKPIPKTRDEFRNMVVNAMTAPDGSDVSEFLDQYDFNE